MKVLTWLILLQFLTLLSFAQSSCTDGARLDEEEIRNLKYGPVPNGSLYARKPESNNNKWAHPDEARSDDTQYVQGLISEVGENGTIYFHKGIYKISGLKLKSNLTLVGEEGATFTGEEKLTSQWTRMADNLWMYPYPKEPVVFNPIDKGGRASTRCEGKGNLCQLTQDLFLNNRWLNRVGSIAMLKKEGDWVFDEGSDGLEDNKLVLYTSTNPNNVTKLSSKKKAFYDVASRDDKSASRNLSKINIFNIEFTNYTESPVTTGSDWTVANNTFKNNHLSGIMIRGNNVQIKWNQFIYNGSTGIGANTKNSRLFENKIAFNNQAKYAKEWNAGGMKSIAAQNFEVYRNYVHDNLATGLWSDVFEDGTSYHHNLLERNKTGIHYEISTNGNIHDNILIDNVNYGIEVVSSSSVEVYNNTVTYSSKSTQNGIIIIQDDRGYAGDCADKDPSNDPVDKNPNDDQIPCNMQVHNIRVHHNYIKTAKPNNMAAGLRVTPKNFKRWKAPGSPSPDRFYKSYYNVKFDSNRYELANNLAFFYWGWSTRDSSTVMTRWNWYTVQDAGACTNLLSAKNLKLEVEGESGTTAGKEKKNTSERRAAPGPENSNSTLLDADTANNIRFDVKVPQAGDYKIYARILLPKENDAQPLWVKVNNGPWVRWNVQKYSTFSWEQISKERFFLKANNTNNTITLSYPKNGTILDKIRISATEDPL